MLCRKVLRHMQHPHVLKELTTQDFQRQQLQQLCIDLRTRAQNAHTRYQQALHRQQFLLSAVVVAVDLTVAVAVAAANFVTTRHNLYLEFLVLTFG
jgi:predicted lysophospholipase L1 biosynthesis ABC-type transport system permease subunit